MTTPSHKPGSEVAMPRQAPVFRTSSGALVTATPGKPVEIADAKRLVDVCIVMDTTGSMSDKIDGLKQCMVEFVGELAKLKLDWRLTAVPFGDLTVPGDRVDGHLPFVTTQQAGVDMIRRFPRFSGGANEGESSLEAMQAAMSKRYRKDAVKVLVVFTDEPPLTGPQLTPRTIDAALAREEFICFVASQSRQGYEPWANDHGGKWYPIGSSMDTSSLLAFLRGLLKDVARASQAVHSIGGGSVRKYVESEQRRKALGGGSGVLDR